METYQVTTSMPKLIVDAVLEEVERAIEKHPGWPIDIIHAGAIVSKESGELTRECLQIAYEHGDYNNAQKEAIQTAATAFRFLYGLADGSYL